MKEVKSYPWGSFLLNKYKEKKSKCSHKYTGCP